MYTSSPPGPITYSSNPRYIFPHSVHSMIQSSPGLLSPRTPGAARRHLAFPPPRLPLSCSPASSFAPSLSLSCSRSCAPAGPLSCTAHRLLAPCLDGGRGLCELHSRWPQASCSDGGSRRPLAAHILSSHSRGYLLSSLLRRHNSPISCARCLKFFFG